MPPGIPREIRPELLTYCTNQTSAEGHVSDSHVLGIRDRRAPPKSMARMIIEVIIPTIHGFCSSDFHRDPAFYTEESERFINLPISGLANLISHGFLAFVKELQSELDLEE